MKENLLNFLNESIARYNLNFRDQSPWYFLDFNDKVTLNFLEDFDSIDLSITIKSHPNIIINPYTFIHFYYGNSIELNDIKLNNTDKISYLKHYNQLILKYLYPIFNENQEWVLKFIKYTEKQDQLARFIAGIDEASGIRKKRRSNDPSWEDDARALYEKLNGPLE